MKVYLSLNLRIDIISSSRSIGYFIMSYIVNIVLSQKINSDDPGTWANNFIYPSAMSQNVRSFLLIHYYLSFLFNGLFIATYTNYQVSIWEEFFGLFKNSCMSNVKHIKYSISIYSNWIIGVGSIGLYTNILMIIKFTTP